MRHSGCKRKGGVVAAVLAAALAAPAAAQVEAVAAATMLDADGNDLGVVSFTGSPNGVLVEVMMVGLPPGPRGIHLHETGDCSDGFAAAGGHFAPEGREHGFFNADGPHAGDLPNIFVGPDGTAAAHFFNMRVTLDDGPAGLLDADGTAVIVHELPDSYETEAGAEGRLGCGVIEPPA